MEAMVVAGCFASLAVAHSVLGEQAVIRPLVASRWSAPGLAPTPAARLMRFAWHLTSLAWVGLGAIVVGADAVATVGLVAAVSTVLIVVLLPGHFAWALFAIAALAAGVGTGFLGTAALSVAGWAGVVVLVAIALVHLYWAGGGRRWADDVVPTEPDGQPSFVPTPLQTVAVAAAMLVLVIAVAAVLVNASWWAVAGRDVTRWIVVGGVAVLAARAVGDGRRVGFTKADHDSGFGRRDDAVYTPLVTALALAGSAVLVA